MAAATRLMEVVQQATGAINAQEALEKVKADPAVAAAAAKAVESRWMEIAEAGGGGIDGARKADAVATASGDLLPDPPLLDRVPDPAAGVRAGVAEPGRPDRHGHLVG
ncbi:MAG: hypothetical protein IPM06_22105 [Rhizobiales bacterium]|nr:hypothetical protein [Hyphomicrobiales bacterium]